MRKLSIPSFLLFTAYALNTGHPVFAFMALFIAGCASAFEV